jgi:hypothetical protein
MVAFYPIIYYSKKEHVIPEALNQMIMPPLTLTKTSMASPYLRFKGSNMNFDGKEMYFVLNDVEVFKDMPYCDYSFVMSFDYLVSSYRTEYLDKKFNLLHFYLINAPLIGNKETVSRVSVDIAITNITLNSTNPVHSFQGNAQLLISYIEAGVQKNFNSQMYEISLSKKGTLFELINSPGFMYKNQSTLGIDMVQIFSTQLFLFKVKQKPQ